MSLKANEAIGPVCQIIQQIEDPEEVRRLIGAIISIFDPDPFDDYPEYLPITDVPKRKSHLAPVELQQLHRKKS